MLEAVPVTQVVIEGSIHLNRIESIHLILKSILGKYDYGDLYINSCVPTNFY